MLMLYCCCVCVVAVTQFCVLIQCVLMLLVLLYQRPSISLPPVVLLSSLFVVVTECLDVSTVVETSGLRSAAGDQPAG